MNKLTIKKITAVMLAALTAFCLTACVGTPVTTTAEPVSTPAQTQPIVITTAADTTPAETTAPDTTAAPETTVPEETTEAPSTEPETTEAPEPFGEEDLVLVVDGVELSLRMDFVPVKDQILGGNYDEQVGQACVGGGNDRAYYCDGEAVSVYTVGSASGEQTIYDIYITLLKGFTTQKGAVIGETTRDEVLAIYGEPYSTFPASERYSVDGNLELIFGFDGEILSSVGLHDNEVQ